MILKALITLIFVGAAVLKLTGKVAPNWERWGYSRQFMYSTGIAELVAVAFFWWPGLELAGAAGARSGAARRIGNPHQASRGSSPYRHARNDAASGDGAVVPVTGRLT